MVSVPPIAMLGGAALLMFSIAGIGHSSSAVEVLEPQKWIGKPFELAHDISDGDRLLDGSWLVVLYHHGCSRCQKSLLDYQRLAGGSKNDRDACQFALVEVPPYGKAVGRVFQYYRLSDRKKWFVVTPTEVRVTNGKVVAVSVGKDTISQ